MTVSDSEEKTIPEKQSGFVEGCYEWAEAFIMPLIAVMILSVFLFRFNIMVEGNSMLPNYVQNYRVFVSCIDRNFTTGNVVVIDANGTALKIRLIKRVIATEGQKVNIDSSTGYVYVDDKKLDESAYIQNGITTQTGETQFPLTVPKGKVFVLGDNRQISQDSRFKTVGLIDTRYIVGKVEFLLSPFHGFQSR